MIRKVAGTLRQWGAAATEGEHQQKIAADLRFDAGVAELVDALDLGSSGESRGGSSPSARTISGIDR